MSYHKKHPNMSPAEHVILLDMQSSKTCQVKYVMLLIYPYMGHVLL